MLYLSFLPHSSFLGLVVASSTSSSSLIMKVVLNTPTAFRLLKIFLFVLPGRLLPLLFTVFSHLPWFECFHRLLEEVKSKELYKRDQLPTLQQFIVKLDALKPPPAEKNAISIPYPLPQIPNPVSLIFSASKSQYSGGFFRSYVLFCLF